MTLPEKKQPLDNTPLRSVRLSRKPVPSQGEIGRAVGVDRSTINRIERGLQTPSPETAAAIAAYFGHAITEMQIIYPERYISLDKKDIDHA